jgi:hypothetical protein
MVMTPVGAFFNDFGPLAAGTYYVNAEIWLTPWPSTSGVYLHDQGSLQFTVTGADQTLRGDFNGDNVVDAGDYVAWRKEPSTTSNDYYVWRTHFGEPAGSGSGANVNTNIPEPATLVILIMAAAGIRLLGRHIA